jgi:hypothetical protein
VALVSCQLACILASRCSIICCISIMWRYSFILRSPRPVSGCDFNPATFDNRCYVVCVRL